MGGRIIKLFCNLNRSTLRLPLCLNNIVILIYTYQIIRAHSKTIIWDCQLFMYHLITCTVLLNLINFPSLPNTAHRTS